jgi:hypothetical protein
VSKDKVLAILSTAVVPDTDTLVHKKYLSPSELQAEVMAEEEKGGTRLNVTFSYCCYVRLI